MKDTSLKGAGKCTCGMRVGTKYQSHFVPPEAARCEPRLSIFVTLPMFASSLFGLEIIFQKICISKFTNREATNNDEGS